MLWNLHILEKPCRSCKACPCESRDKFREDIYTRILILLKIYVELRLNKNKINDPVRMNF